jgi:hypothetical protein
MSPKAGFVLVQEIVPRIRSGVLRGMKTVGAEDIEELIQDCIAHAAQMLHRVEETGKEVTPGNIAYYAILHTRSGRRSTGGSRADVMAPGTQLDGKSSVLSFEEPVGFDPETNEEIPLGEMLSNCQDDPSMSAARNLDWEEFLGTHDHRYGAIVGAAASGSTMKPVAARYNCSLSTISSVKGRLCSELREVFGDNIVAETTRPAAWKSSIVVEKEKAACRAERRRA